MSEEVNKSESASDVKTYRALQARHKTPVGLALWLLDVIAIDLCERDDPTVLELLLFACTALMDTAGKDAAEAYLRAAVCLGECPLSEGELRARHRLVHLARISLVLLAAEAGEQTAQEQRQQANNLAHELSQARAELAKSEAERALLAVESASRNDAHAQVKQELAQVREELARLRQERQPQNSSSSEGERRSGMERRSGEERRNRNGAGRRTDPLRAVIDLARSQAAAPGDWSSEWAALVVLAQASGRPAPLLGYTEGEGVKWQSDDDALPVRYLTREAFRKRVTRPKT